MTKSDEKLLKRINKKYYAYSYIDLHISAKDVVRQINEFLEQHKLSDADIHLDYEESPSIQGNRDKTEEEIQKDFVVLKANEANLARTRRENAKMRKDAEYKTYLKLHKKYSEEK